MADNEPLIDTVKAYALNASSDGTVLSFSLERDVSLYTGEDFLLDTGEALPEPGFTSREDIPVSFRRIDKTEGVRFTRNRPLRKEEIKFDFYIDGTLIESNNLNYNYQLVPEGAEGFEQTFITIRSVEIEGAESVDQTSNPDLDPIKNQDKQNSKLKFAIVNIEIETNASVGGLSETGVILADNPDADLINKNYKDFFTGPGIIGESFIDFRPRTTFSPDDYIKAYVVSQGAVKYSVPLKIKDFLPDDVYNAYNGTTGSGGSTGGGGGNAGAQEGDSSGNNTTPIEPVVKPDRGGSIGR